MVSPQSDGGTNKSELSLLLLYNYLHIFLLSFKAIDCGRLSTPHKVLIVSETGHTRLGGYVKYRCKEKGYELIGSETRVCQNDEQWSGVEPSCQSKYYSFTN